MLRLWSLVLKLQKKKKIIKTRSHKYRVKNRQLISTENSLVRKYEKAKVDQEQMRTDLERLSRKKTHRKKTSPEKEDEIKRLTDELHFITTVVLPTLEESVKIQEKETDKQQKQLEDELYEECREDNEAGWQSQHLLQDNYEKFRALRLLR